MQNLSVMLCGMALIVLAAGAVSAQTMIYDIDDLQNMQNNLAEDYVLANNINAGATSTWNSGEGFAPVGTSGAPFTGSFDGAGYTIMGLYINRPSTASCGLFGVTDGSVDTVTISNVTLTSVNITGAGASGSLVGNAGEFTSLSNCSANGTVTGSGDAVGGLVGNGGLGITLSECSANCTVTGSGDAVGGLVGWTPAAQGFTNCFASGTVSGVNTVGGLVGNAGNGLVFANCSADCTVIGSGNTVGGLAGEVGGSGRGPHVLCLWHGIRRGYRWRFDRGD